MATGHILVLEDDPAIRDLLQQMLTDEGYTVECACNGAEALAAVERSAPALVLLDLHLQDRLAGDLFNRHVGVAVNRFQNRFNLGTLAHQQREVVAEQLDPQVGPHTGNHLVHPQLNR